MFSAVLHGVEDLRIEDWQEPSPGPGEVKVRFRAGGICGSDLSYFYKGKSGDFAQREPFALGHEVAGEIAALGSGVADLAVGQPVAVNPARPCGECDYCRTGHANHCTNMRFMGSASVFPHMQGAFREFIVVAASQCVPLPAGVSFAEASMAEPLAVALHALHRAGPLLGARMMIVGAGPIGCMLLLAARGAGVRQLVAADLADGALAKAAELGAHETVHAQRDAARLQAWAERKGTFDVVVEASGSAAGLATALRVARARGKVVQVGNLPSGEVPVPANLIMSKELDYVGSFRFDREYRLAVDEIVARRIDVRPLMTHRFGIDDAREAFRVAADRSQSMKVHLLA